MKIKEKVLEKLGCNEGEEEKAIDLTLTEVGKVIDNKKSVFSVKKWDSKRKRYETMISKEELKKELGI